ncbi:CARDB domain-containing protein [Psychroserpens luteus]|uniref:CARDB domain-containing protein n=1 Tax=Psychroserpens luteus TaxID=1434066 RepID=A0ABW5ZUY9_9FLAO|nr:CARDB domain-containing protein [Psychroserpens luteus]
MLQLNRLLYLTFIAFIFCFKLFSQSDYNFDIQYYDGENHYFKFSDVSSDYGLRRLSNTNLYDYHGGLDFAFNGIQGNIIIAQKEYTIDRIDVDGNGLKSIVFTDGTSFRHIFLGTSIPDCNNESTLGGFLLIERFCNTDEYVIINTIDNIAYGPNNGTITYNGNPYNITNTIGIGNKVAPIGNSGGYGAHFHLQNSFNINNLNDDVSTNNPLYDLSYERSEAVSYNLDVTNLFTNNYLRGYDKHPFKVKVTFNNLEEVPNTDTRFINSVFDLENIKLQIKPLLGLGQYETMETLEESFISIGGAQNSAPLPSYIGISNDDENIIGSENKTGIQPFAYSELVTTNQNDFDNYFFADFRPRFSIDNSDAELSEDAKYPDGKYFIRSSLTDIKGNIYESEPAGITIDNFRPYVERVLVIFSLQDVYHKRWERNGNVLELIGPDEGTTFEDGDEFHVRIFSSEPLEELNLQIEDTAGVFPLNPNASKTQWDIDLIYSGPTIQRDLILTGLDTNNNDLLKGENISNLNNHQISTSSSGRMANDNLTGEDRTHKINVTDPCNITANAGSNVTIQSGGSTTLQGSGGTSCSWSPTTGLSNSNSCTPTASPSQTTTYTLTVTENGCTDTDTVTVTVDGSVGGNPPANDDCNNATTLTSNTSCNFTSGTVEDATLSVGANNCLGCGCESPDDYDVYYKFIAVETSHTVTISNYASNFDAVIELRTSCSSGSSNYISCYDPSGAPSSVSETWNNLNIGQTYYIRVFEWDYQGSPPNIDTFDICVTHQNSNTDGIDLVSDVTSVSNDNPDQGDTINVDYTISNIGDESISNEAFVGGLYLSTNQTFGSSDTILSGSTQGLTNIGSGQTISITKSVSIPNVNDGQYYIISVPDIGDNIDESEENNNNNDYPIYIGEYIENGPDLDITGMTVTPNSGLVPGQEVEIELEIENEGNEDSSSFDVLLYLDIDDDSNYDSNEFMGEFNFGSLDAGEENAITLDFDLPTNIPSTGTYELVALADSNNDVNETDEGNNDRDRNITIALTGTGVEDVTVINSYISTNSVNAGGTIDAFTNHIYLGNQNSSDLPTLRIGYYLSEDCEFSYEVDIFLDDGTSNLGINNPNIEEDETLIIPETTSSGTYYILFVADSNNDIDEGVLENNNSECIEINVISSSIPEGDIFITDEICNPTNVVIGSEIEPFANINYTGSQLNADLPSIEIFYFLSDDCILSNDDMLIDDNGISLGSDLPINDVSSSIELPDNLSPGSYYIIFRADMENTVNEINENNNIACAQFNLLPADSNYQDVTLNNPYVEVTEANIGDQVYVSVYQNYTGYQTDADMSSPRLHYYLSTDCELSSDDYYLEDDPSGIGSDDPSEFESQTITIPGDASTGDYYILFVADATEIVIENNESNNLECIPITINDGTLEVNNNELSNEIKIYPNPFDEKINISLSKTYSNIEIEIFNVIGQKIIQYTFENKQDIEINTEDLSNGLYFLKVKLNDVISEEFKLIKR